MTIPLRSREPRPIDQLAPAVRYLLMYGTLPPRGIEGRVSAFRLLFDNDELQRVWQDVREDLVLWCRTHPADPIADDKDDMSRPRPVLWIEGPALPCERVYVAPRDYQLGVYGWLTEDEEDDE